MTFEYRDSLLHCESVSLDSLANEIGTPLYVYSLDRVRENYRRLQVAFAPLGATIHYSMKANANLAVIKTLLAEGAGLDAVSGGEIYRALTAGATPAQIVFAGVGKTVDELNYALEQGVGCLNVESVQELERLTILAQAHGKRPTVALRLNPDVQARTHPYIATGHGGAKFGMSEEDVRAVLSQPERHPSLAIVGLHIHIGSQLASAAETETAARRALKVMDDFPLLNRLNLGGGFPVAYESESYPPIEAFAEAIGSALSGRVPGSIALSIEPGRYLVAEAGALVVTVQYVKYNGRQRIIVTDGGMTELIRPALYNARHPVWPIYQAKPNDSISEAEVVGPICESADVLRSAAPLPPIMPGDRLAVLVVGAYGATMGSNYNARLRPPEIVVEGETRRIVRRRETWDDLIQLEKETKG